MSNTETLNALCPLPSKRVARFNNQLSELDADISRLLSRKEEIRSLKALDFITLLVRELGGSEGEAVSYKDLEAAYFEEFDSCFHDDLRAALDAGRIQRYARTLILKESEFILTRSTWRMLGE